MKFVPIKQKIIIFGFLATILVSAILYLVLNFAVVKGVGNLENDNVEMNLQRIENSLDRYFIFLNQKSGDWAKWDATYEFVDDLNEAYVDENMTIEALSTMDVNMIIYLNDSGEIVYSKGIDLETGQYQEVPDDIRHNIPLIYQKMLKKEEGEAMHDYLDIKNHPPLLFVANHILKSDGSGPSKGLLIMGRYLDRGVLQTFEKNTLFPISFADLDDAFLSSDFALAEAQLSKGESAYIVRENQKIFGYSMYSDPLDHRFIFKIEMPRELVGKYLETIRYTLLIIFFAGLLLSLMTYFAFKKIVLNPLAQLHSEVENIADGRYIENSIISGNDEIALLSKKINELLRQLALAEKNMQKKNDELEQMNNFMVGREVKMSELKEEIKRLKKHKKKS